MQTRNEQTRKYHSVRVIGKIYQSHAVGIWISKFSVKYFDFIALKYKNAKRTGQTVNVNINEASPELAPGRLHLSTPQRF